MKLKKCLAVLLSVATVFSCVFTSMAEVAVVEEVASETADFEVIDLAETATVDLQGAETPAVEVEEVMEEASEISAKETKEAALFAGDFTTGTMGWIYEMTQGKLYKQTDTAAFFKHSFNTKIYQDFHTQAQGSYGHYTGIETDQIMAVSDSTYSYTLNSGESFAFTILDDSVSYITLSGFTDNFSYLNGTYYEVKCAINYKDKGGEDFSGTHETGYPTIHTYGTATNLKGATKTGYTFGGWYKDEDCLETSVTSLGAEDYVSDITLYAFWGHKLTFDVSEGITGLYIQFEGDDEPVYFTAEECLEPATVPAGMKLTFTKVDCEDGYACTMDLPYTYTVPDHDDTVAITAQKTVALTFNISEGITGLYCQFEGNDEPKCYPIEEFAEPMEMFSGAKLIITNVVCEDGYACTMTLPYTYTMPDKDDTVAITAEKTGSYYTVTVNITNPEYGTVEPESIKVVEGTTAQISEDGTKFVFSDGQTITPKAKDGYVIQSMACGMCYGGITKDTFVEVSFAKKSNPKPDPTPTPVRDSSDNDNTPLFTGTWSNAVTNGSWSQDSNGIWHYTSTEKFKATWGYIINPYAGEGQNKADWFWFDSHGNMLTGWQFINGKWYYLNPTKDGTLGACLIGPAKTPDGYEVDASGAWTGR